MSEVRELFEQCLPWHVFMRRSTSHRDLKISSQNARLIITINVVLDIRESRNRARNVGASLLSSLLVGLFMLDGLGKHRGQKCCPKFLSSCN